MNDVTVGLGRWTGVISFGWIMFAVLWVAVIFWQGDVMQRIENAKQQDRAMQAEILRRQQHIDRDLKYGWVRAMTMRQTYISEVEVTCDGCKATMKVSSHSAVPPGWKSEQMKYDVSLHACLRCDLAPLVAEYRRRTYND